MKAIKVLTAYNWVWLTTGLLFLSGCSVNPVTGKKELMLVSEKQEVAMGLQYDPSVIANFGLYEDEKLQAFIQEKGVEMGKISHRPHLEYKFRVLDSPVVNAFAVPGGFVYFTRGIMAHFNNEAEFAGVLGHEIGHITARHSAAQMSNQQLATIGLLGTAIAAPKIMNDYGGILQQSMGLLFLKFGRDDESQSDKLGVEYSTRIGYNAHEMADFFKTLKRLSAKSGQSIPTFMSTHPDPADRYNKVHQHAQNWQQQLGKSNLAVNRDQYLQMIDGIVYGEDPRQGFFENNYFYHPVLKFQFPTPPNWRKQNSPQAVQMAPENGKAAMILTLGQGKSPQEAAQAFNQANNNEQVVSTVISSQNTTVNGMPAFVMLSEMRANQQQQQQQTTQQQPQAIRDLSYFIQYGGNIYQIRGMAYLQDYNTYENTFLNTMRNFNVLRDSEKLNRQPDRIRIKKISRSTTVEQALRSFGIPANRLEELAIVNGMELKDQINSGMLIKVVGK